MTTRNAQITMDLFFVGVFAVLTGVGAYYHLTAAVVLPAALGFAFFLGLTLLHIGQAQAQEGGAVSVVDASPKRACPPHNWRMESGRYRCQTPGCRVFPG